MKLTRQDKIFWPVIMIIDNAKSSKFRYFATWAVTLMLACSTAMFSVYQQVIGNGEEYRIYTVIPIVLFFYAAYGFAQWISWRSRMDYEAELIMRKLHSASPGFIRMRPDNQ